jgi:hypothetical protein
MLRELLIVAVEGLHIFPCETRCGGSFLDSRLDLSRANWLINGPALINATKERRDVGLASRKSRADQVSGKLAGTSPRPLNRFQCHAARRVWDFSRLMNLCRRPASSPSKTFAGPIICIWRYQVYEQPEAPDAQIETLVPSLKDLRRHGLNSY